jgi:hypothetical protein
VPRQDPIFFDQVGHALLLPGAERASQHRQKHPRGGDVDHRGSLYHRLPFGAAVRLGRVLGQYEIVDDVALLLMDPASDGPEKELQWM